ncbi:hypothetical protein [Streptomyces naphthomycinicus]|uniref:hypothetical protein n=1 Tax=Streptomyces naphthomycinicus TaxID=2872625 RepID=UPI001CED28F6|nr:hypothetical protein [Streptomyces sp. TML10]
MYRIDDVSSVVKIAEVPAEDIDQAFGFAFVVAVETSAACEPGHGSLDCVNLPAIALRRSARIQEPVVPVARSRHAR